MKEFEIRSANLPKMFKEELDELGCDIMQKYGYAVELYELVTDIHTKYTHRDFLRATWYNADTYAKENL